MLPEDIKITTLEQYQELATRTWNPLREQIKDSLHCTAGIATEFHEFLKAEDSVNEIEEIGDLSWFLAIYCKVHGIALPIGISMGFTVDIDDCIMGLLNMDKANLAYNRPYNREQQERFVTELWRNWADTCFMLRVTASKADQKPLTEAEFLMYVLETNIKKLMKRFPEKYSDEAANNRDLEAERKVLENGNS